MLKRGDEGSDANRVLPEAAIAADWKIRKT